MARLRDLFNLFRWELSRSTKRLYRDSSILSVIIGGLLYFYDVGEHFLHWLPEPPKKLLYGVVVFLVIAGILHLFHQMEQWKESIRERRFAKSLVLILDEFWTLDFEAIGAGNEQILAAFATRALGLISECLLCNEPSFSVMTQPQRGSKLEIFYKYPPNKDFGDYSPLPGEGAAGVTFEDNQTVYVPIIKDEWGMKLSKQGVIEGWDAKLFKKSRFDPFECVFCVPISVTLLSGGGAFASNVLGVLNLHSTRAYGIKDFDMDVAQVTARLLALFLDKREKERYHSGR
jgi:hypothetical protein